MSSPRGPHFSTKTWPHPTTWRLQCWKALGQTTKKTGTQHTHQKTGCLKSYRAKSHINTHPLTWPCPPEGQDPAPTNRGTSPSNQEAYTSPRSKLTHQGANTRIKRNYDPAACIKETTIQKVRQSEMTEKYVAD